MTALPDWRPVYDYWFPHGLDAGAARHRAMFLWWFSGGANAGLRNFTSLVADAKSGRLDAWRAAPLRRLALILVLDQFTRGLHAGTSEAYAGDPAALRIAEEGLALGHFDALAQPWEKTFFMLPLAHVEGPGHAERLGRALALAEKIARDAPEALRPLYEHSLGQARANHALILRFGRFPHRNAVLGRASTPEEQAYVKKGEFIHRRAPPPTE